MTLRRVLAVTSSPGDIDARPVFRVGARSRNRKRGRRAAIINILPVSMTPKEVYRRLAGKPTT
jgi:hypothetical protein